MPIAPSLPSVLARSLQDTVGGRPNDGGAGEAQTVCSPRAFCDVARVLPEPFACRPPVGQRIEGSRRIARKHLLCINLPRNPQIADTAGGRQVSSADRVPHAAASKTAAHATHPARTPARSPGRSRNKLRKKAERGPQRRLRSGLIGRKRESDQREHALTMAECAERFCRRRGIRGGVRSVRER